MAHKKNIIVANESPDLHSSKRLIYESNKLNYSFHWLNPYHFLISSNSPLLVNQNEQNTYFHRTTGVRYDDFDLTVSKHHSHFGYNITNPLNALQTFRSKDNQALFFFENNFSSIKTISYRGKLNDKYWDIITNLSHDNKFIIKMSRGNQGVGVNFINGLQSLKGLLETFNAIQDQKFIIQPFIEHKKEWRIFIIKNEIIGIVEREINKEDFRGNSQYSFGKYIKILSPEIQNEALRAARLSGLDYCGIDIIDNGDSFAFLEINSVPGFKQIEELSSLNIARELIIKL